MPKRFPFRVFLDGADPSETLEAKVLLGFLDGQTTNPTLIAKNPELIRRLAENGKFSVSELMDFYKKIVAAIASVVDWSVSIEPYVDSDTTAGQIIAQAREMAAWTSKAWIKFPATSAGLEAAHTAVREGIRVNATLVFSQEQAAGIYSATRDAREPVFVSPFVGRLDDRGENGMQLTANIIRMLEAGDGHLLTLTASVRNIKHLLYALKLQSPIITLPLKVLREWAKMDFFIPPANYIYDPVSFKSIPYREISLEKNWQEYDLTHPLTDAGISRFCEDWNKLVK